MGQRSAPGPAHPTGALRAAGALLLALCAETGAAASPPSGDVRANIFDLLDSDGDGRISYSETMADPALNDEYNRLDNNKDGELDRGEFAEFEAQGLRKRPGILPPEPSHRTEQAPRLPSRDSELDRPPPEPPPGVPTTDALPRGGR